MTINPFTIKPRSIESIIKSKSIDEFLLDENIKTNQSVESPDCISAISNCENLAAEIIKNNQKSLIEEQPIVTSNTNKTSDLSGIKNDDNNDKDQSILSWCCSILCVLLILILISVIIYLIYKRYYKVETLEDDTLNHNTLKHDTNNDVSDDEY